VSKVIGGCCSGSSIRVALVLHMGSLRSAYCSRTALVLLAGHRLVYELGLETTSIQFERALTNAEQMQHVIEQRKGWMRENGSRAAMGDGWYGRFAGV